jgi:hypothetical protein
MLAPACPSLPASEAKAPAPTDGPHRGSGRGLRLRLRTAPKLAKIVLLDQEDGVRLHPPRIDGTWAALQRRWGSRPSFGGTHPRRHQAPRPRRTRCSSR